MTIRESTGWNEFGAIALAVRRVYELPAVPTLDWCVRAAGAMTSLAPRTVARVWLVVATPTGTLLDATEAGAADGRAEGQPRSVRFDPVGDRSSLGWWIPADRAPLRCRASRIEDAVVPSDTDAMHDAWWRSLAVEPRVVGLAPFEPVEFGRHLGVELAWSGASGADAGACVPRLEATLRELARRALVAFGPEPLGPANRVTDREREVLDMLAHGRSVRDIADALGRSPHTVHDHVKSLHRKLRVSTRGELIARAMGHMGTSAVVAHRRRASFTVEPGE